MSTLLGLASFIGVGTTELTNGTGGAGCRSHNSTPVASAITKAAAASFGQRLVAFAVGGALTDAAATGLGALALLGAAALWFHYGTAVFFEMIAAGISACF